MFLAKFFASIGNFKERMGDNWSNFWCYVDEVRNGKRIADNGKCRGIRIGCCKTVNGGCLTCKYYVGHNKEGEENEVRD